MPHIRKTNSRTSFRTAPPSDTESSGGESPIAPSSRFDIKTAINDCPSPSGEYSPKSKNVSFTQLQPQPQPQPKSLQLVRSYPTPLPSKASAFEGSGVGYDSDNDYFFPDKAHVQAIQTSKSVPNFSEEDMVVSMLHMSFQRQEEQAKRLERMERMMEMMMQRNPQGFDEEVEDNCGGVVSGGFRGGAQGGAQVGFQGRAQGGAQVGFRGGAQGGAQVGFQGRAQVGFRDGAQGGAQVGTQVGFRGGFQGGAQGGAQGGTQVGFRGGAQGGAQVGFRDGAQVGFRGGAQVGFQGRAQVGFRGGAQGGAQSGQRLIASGGSQGGSENSESFSLLLFCDHLIEKMDDSKICDLVVETTQSSILARVVLLVLLNCIPASSLRVQFQEEASNEDEQIVRQLKDTDLDDLHKFFYSLEQIDPNFEIEVTDTGRQKRRFTFKVSDLSDQSNDEGLLALMRYIFDN
jgi:hypothetical protein